MYKVDNLLVMRRPTFSLDFYKRHTAELTEIEDMRAFIVDMRQNDLLMQSIYLASASLYETIVGVGETTKDKMIRNVYRSIQKYVIRATTKTTPFGTFSGLAFGTFDSHCTAEFSEDDLIGKHVKIDMRWITDLVAKLEQDQAVLRQLWFEINDICYVNGDRIVNPHIVNAKNASVGPANKVTVTNINYTKAIDLVLKGQTRGKFTFGDMESLLKTHYPDLPDDKMHDFILTLIRQEIILSELRFPLCNIEPLSYIIQVLEKISVDGAGMLADLRAIQSLIADMNASDPASFIPLHKACKTVMRNIVELEVDHYLTCDALINCEHLTLPQSVKETIEHDYVDFMSLLNYEAPDNQVESYRDKFIETYGYYCEVPVLYLLDDSTGLGTPYTQSVNPSNYVSDLRKIEKIIADKMIQAGSTAQPIQLDDDDIRLFSKDKPPKHNEAASCEMSFYVLADSAADIENDNYEIMLAPIKGSNEALKILGRFTDIVDGDILRKIDAIRDQKVQLLSDDHIVLVEAYETPQTSRVGNLIINRSNAKDYLFISATNPQQVNRISLSDLYIGIDQSTNFFYIKSATLNKRIEISCTSCANPTLSNPIFRFLLDISSHRNLSHFYFCDALANIAWCHIPAIKYKKVILTPERWNFEIDTDRVLQSFEAFVAFIAAQKAQLNICKHVMWGVGDRILYLDLDNHNSLYELFAELKKSNDTKIQFTNPHLSDEHLWLKDANGEPIMAEFIVQLLRDKRDKNHAHPSQEQKRSLLLPTQSDILYNARKLNDTDHRLLPGMGNWWFYKLYHNPKFTHQFIKEITGFTSKLVKEDMLNLFFFIRYSDSDSHIRLRFQLKSSERQAEFINQMNAWIVHLSRQLILKSAHIESYDRELERYGGVELIAHAELFFFYDSVFVASLNTILADMQDYERDLAIVSVIAAMLSDCGLSKDEQFGFLDQPAYQNENKTIYREHKDDYLKAVDDNIGIEAWIRDPQVLEYHRARSIALKRYWQAVLDTDQRGGLTNSKDDILRSVVHMYCNRTAGPIEFERYVLSMVKLSLKDYINRQRYKK